MTFLYLNIILQIKLPVGIQGTNQMKNMYEPPLCFPGPITRLKSKLLGLQLELCAKIN